MRILAFCSTYLPSYRGGTVRAVAGIVDRLGGEYDFHVLTRDRDDGVDETAPGIEPGRWKRLGNATVYYAAPRDLAPGRMAHLASSILPDAYYVNSFLSPTFGSVPVFLRWLGLIPRRPLVLAPRGEFHPSALALGRLKKRAFIELVRRLPAHADLLWQAGSNDEAEQIRKVFPRAEIMIARDLTELRELPKWPRTVKKAGELSVAYLSRITPMKNLAGAIRILGQVKGDVRFSVYGPSLEKDYLDECLDEARRLPPHVQVRFEGEVPHERVLETLSLHHVFFLPTLGESFGHAILEALVAGCLPIIGDQTPWKDLRRIGVGWNLPPTDGIALVRALQACVDMDDEEHAKAWTAARAFGLAAANSHAAEDENRALFDRLHVTQRV